MEIKQLYNGIKIDVKIKSGVNLLTGFSGTGKTLLMQAIELFCMKNKLKCRYLDYRCRDLTAEQIINQCCNADILLLDNADLYLTNELLEQLKKDSEYIVISMKDITDIDMSEVFEYIVHYDNQKLLMEEF